VGHSVYTVLFRRNPRDLAVDDVAANTTTAEAS